MNNTHTVPGIQSALRLAMSYKGRRSKTWGEGYDELPATLKQERTREYMAVRARLELLYKTPRRGLKALLVHVEDGTGT